MENEPEPPCLRLKWRQTWEDKDADYVAEAPTYNGSVGRIYRHDTGGFLKGSWFWAFQAHSDEVSRNIGDTSGYEGSARAAAGRVEQCWFLSIKGTRHEVPEPARPRVNAYAAAKGRAESA
jgi:hypothetical protein